MVCSNLYQKDYYKRNKERINKKHKDFYKNTDGSWHKNYYLKNKKLILEKKRKYYYEHKRKKLGINSFCKKWEDWEIKILKEKLPIFSMKEIQRRYLIMALQDS
jgi:hypothetical protein